jgi:spore coat polysaccharide biosynthesis protein SpsF (cytidylyltransferase family)
MSPQPQVFIQARMSSERFPGKVLAPFHDRPLIAYLIDHLNGAVGREHIILATSSQSSDDPLAEYGRALGVRVFRGDLNSVVKRFQDCLSEHPCEWFFRVCADSPLVDLELLREMHRRTTHENIRSVDLVTNVFPRTYPKGQSLELLRAATFAALDEGALQQAQREHVTKVYYDHPHRYGILNLRSPNPLLASMSLAIDTIDDLRRLERRNTSPVKTPNDRARAADSDTKVPKA